MPPGLNEERLGKSKMARRSCRIWVRSAWLRHHRAIGRDREGQYRSLAVERGDGKPCVSVEEHVLIVYGVCVLVIRLEHSGVS
jgi:hypothetical protein